MDTLLVNGDHGLDSRGLPAVVTGDRELIQRALVRLSVRKGSLGGAPTLGSELHRLRGARAEHLDRLALSYVQEALAAMAGVTVESVAVRREDRDEMAVEVAVGIGANHYRLEVGTV